MSEIKNYGKSIRARLLNVAKQEEVLSDDPKLSSCKQWELYGIIYA